MKNDIMYPHYLMYLEYNLSCCKISKGSFSLLKMSNSKFNEFKIRLEIDESFSKRIEGLYRSGMRDQKIDDIFNDFN